MEIESQIYLIRGLKVMLDHDLAELYQIPTKHLKQQVKRNSERFPSDFMFPLTNQELAILRSQFVTSRLDWGGTRYAPMAFTEQGIAMLSSVLHSDRAIEVNIAIMRAFVKMRQSLSLHKDLEKKLNEMESRYEGKFKVVFDAIKELMSTHSVPRKRVIGLNKEEE
jgi:hypothetical protein